MINLDKFCMAPFREVFITTTGHLKPCCDYREAAPTYESVYDFSEYDKWQKEEMDPLRQDMINNVDNSGCAFCKSTELIDGIRHLRKFHNKQYSNILIPVVEEKATITNIESVQIMFGNYCNLKCIMCSPQNSSSISLEYQQNIKLYKSSGFTVDERRLATVRWWEEQGALDKLMQLTANVNNIDFAGGEPMMIPEIVDILNNLKSTCVVNFSTNLTKLSTKLLNALDRFDLVKINLSLEGIGDHNDYVRYGSDWNTIKAHFDILKNKPNVRINVAHVLQHTSLFAVDKVVEFAEDNRLTYQLTCVYPEEHLHINSAAEADVVKFRKLLNNMKDSSAKRSLQSWVDSYEFDEKYHEKFKNYVDMLDSIRGTDFRKTFNPSW